MISDNAFSKIRLQKAIQQLVQAQDLEYTHAEIAKNIQNYGVSIDGIATYSRLHWVIPGQYIDVSSWPRRRSGNFDAIKIFFQTESYFAIFKPWNVVVEPGAGHKNDNLITWLLDCNLVNRSLSEDKYGVVHRLDKDTQGLMLIAKTPEEYFHLKTQFHDRKVIKRYLTIVNGKLDRGLLVTNWQSRSRTNLLRQKLFWNEKSAVEYDPQSRFAKSTFFPRAYCPDADQTLVEIQIHTGRMHQIRLQCEALGLPILQDSVYHQTKSVTIPSLPHFFPPGGINTLNIQDFEILKTRVFGNENHFLLSNYLQFRELSGRVVELEYLNWYDLIFDLTTN